MSNVSLDTISLNEFAVCGSVTFSSGRDLAMLGKAKFKGLKKVQVDFSKVSAMDSAIVAVMLTWHRFFKANNIDFVFSGGKPNLKVLLKSYGLADLFVFYD